MIINAASPFRTASNCLKIMFASLDELKGYKAPSFTTIKRWVQKVGYYKMKALKDIADDWMIIIDASIQMGEKKCVLILGCRKINLPMNRALILEDLEVLAVKIVSRVDNIVINSLLNQVKLLVGNIFSICSDRGSDILLGIKNFQIANPDTINIGDTAHRVANFLRHTLEKCKVWLQFREQVTQSRRKMQHSKVSGALPPSPRTKARFMNVNSLIQHAVDMLILLDNGISTNEFDINELRMYLAWLPNYRNYIYYWDALAKIGEVARKCVRLENIHMGIVDSFEQGISSVKMGFRELQFADQISLFLMEQSKGMGFGDFSIGSTEVIESLFGKIKYMEREQRAYGFTSLILAALASVGKTDDRLIEAAISSTKLSDIEEWSVNEIGQSVQSQRRKIKKMVADTNNRMEQEFSGVIEVFAMGF